MTEGGKAGREGEKEGGRETQLGRRGIRVSTALNHSSYNLLAYIASHKGLVDWSNRSRRCSSDNAAGTAAHTEENEGTRQIPQPHGEGEGRVASFSLRTSGDAAWAGEIRELCRRGCELCRRGCDLPTTNLGEGGVLCREGSKCQEC